MRNERLVSRGTQSIQVRFLIEFSVQQNRSYSTSRDYLIERSELEAFTIFLKTMVTFSSLKKTLFVSSSILSRSDPHVLLLLLQAKCSRDNEVHLPLRWHRANLRLSDHFCGLHPRSFDDEPNSAIARGDFPLTLASIRHRANVALLRAV